MSIKDGPDDESGADFISPDPENTDESDETDSDDAVESSDLN